MHGEPAEKQRCVHVLAGRCPDVLNGVPAEVEASSVRSRLPRAKASALSSADCWSASAEVVGAISVSASVLTPAFL